MSDKNTIMNTKLFRRKEKGFNQRDSARFIKNLSIVLLLLIFGLTLFSSVMALPVGPSLTFNSTTNSTPRPAVAITTAGGTFTTLVLNATSQTYRWKAYVGNVSGKLALADATNKSIFDWSVTSVTGEVYATRSNVAIDWSSISCADTALINNEDTYMNMSLVSPDSINKTFNNTIHRSFYVGTVNIPSSSCRAIATYVNGSAQIPSENAAFQEILLKDGLSNLIFTTLVNSSTFGYNNQKYDFQMILPENEYNPTPTNYYLYVELI
jgi:hypothetical protein